MPFGIGLLPLIDFAIGQAPRIIDVVSRLLGGRSNDEKRSAASKEVFEVIGEGLKNDWLLPELGSLNGAKVLKAIEDEKGFVERLAALNDAIYQLSKFINNQEVNEDEWRTVS